MADCDGSTGELAEQQPANCRQPKLSRVDRQATGIPHVHVVAAQFFCNGSAGPRLLQDDVLLPQRRQEVRQARPQVTMRPQRRRMVVAARKMEVQELLDEGFVDLLG